MFVKVVLFLSLLCFGMNVDSNSHPRPRRQGGPGGMVAGDLGTAIIGGILDSTIVLETDSEGCGFRWGCHRGYCWASCDATAFNNEWCYTTRGFSQDYRYIRCSSNNDCDRCWRCAGGCTV